MIDMTTMGTTGLLIFLIVAVALLAFWAWMFADMIWSRIPKMMKGVWAVLFIFTFIAAFVWFFVRTKRRRR